MKAASFKTVVPLALSGIFFNSTTNADTFSYNDLKMEGIAISDNSVVNHLKQNSEMDYLPELSRIEFYDLLRKWETDVLFLSSPNEIVDNKHFQKIVSKGEKFVPFIIEELKANPTYLVWSLNLIYGQKITDMPNVTIPEAAKLWIKHLARKQ